MTGLAVLALDDILCKLTPEQAAAFRAMTPTWLLDQTDSTVEQIRRNISTAKAAGAIKTAALAVEQHPGWIRLGICDALVTWWCGQHSTCMHDPHPMRPRPVLAAAWKPGLVVCGRCEYLLRLPEGSEADRTCDGCGRVVTGRGEDLMYPLVVAAGVLGYSVGACRDCRYWETA